MKKHKEFRDEDRNTNKTKKRPKAKLVNPEIKYKHKAHWLEEEESETRIPSRKKRNYHEEE